jgi:hypothetical protein
MSQALVQEKLTQGFMLIAEWFLSIKNLFLQKANNLIACGLGKPIVLDKRAKRSLLLP